MHSSINFLIKLFTLLDPQLLTPLKTQVGKTGQINLIDHNRSLYFTIKPSQIVFSPFIEQPDVILSGQLSNLIQLALSKKEIPPVALFQKYAITLEGEVGILNALHQSFLQHEIDWQGHLASFIGDIPSFGLGKLFQKIKIKYQSFKMDHNRDFALFVQEEAKMSPTPYELAHFYDEVDTLKEATDRIEKKIEAYKNGSI